MLHSHFSCAHIHSIFAEKRAKRFVTVHTISLTPCDNNQWNLFICILTRIASIFRTKIKEKRSEVESTYVSCIMNSTSSCQSVNKCISESKFIYTWMCFISKAKLEINALTGSVIIQLRNEATEPHCHYVCLLSIAWTWPSQPLKCHLPELQLHYNCNLSVLLHLFHFILPFTGYLRYVT